MANARQRIPESNESLKRITVSETRFHGNPG
jgi:hypothetical protein